MPGYELSVVFRTLTRPDLSSVMKRVGTLLLDKGTVLQKIENHGVRDFAHRIIKQDIAFHKGSFFVYHFVSARLPFEEIKDECSRDVDILRFGIVNQYKEFDRECTLDEELRCPAYRPSVKELLEKGKELKEKRKIRYRNIQEYEYFDNYM